MLKMPRKVFRIAAPIGARRHHVARKMKGGFLPAALAIPLLGALGAPVAKYAGDQLVNGIDYLVRKVRGKGVGGRKRRVHRRHTGGSLLTALRRLTVRKPVRRMPILGGRKRVHRRRRVGAGRPRIHISGLGLIRAGNSRANGGRRVHHRHHVLRIRI